MFKNALEKICIALMLSLFLLLLTEVFLRSVLSMSIGWSYEVARVLMIWLVLIGTLLLNLTSQHINISVIESKVKILPKINFWITRITLLIVGVISIHFLSIVIPFNQTSATTGLPQWIYYLIIPVVFILSLLPLKLDKKEG